jgi:hypothetical protein
VLPKKKRKENRTDLYAHLGKTIKKKKKLAWAKGS